MLLKESWIQMENEKLDIYFYGYAIFEIVIALVGAYLVTKGINLTALVIWLQIAGQVFITYEGKKNQRYDTYRIYMGFVVPFIMVSIMLWYNTF